MNMIFDILKNNVDIITGLGIITTFIFNIINLRKILKDNEPQLLFDLRNYHGDLLLIIKNTGKTKATNIKVNIKKIRNNGDKTLCEDFLFCIPFELSSNEQTQGKVSLYGGNYSKTVFPYIDIEVSYKMAHKKKELKYERQVFFNPQTVNEYDNDIAKEIHFTKCALVRIANYFDGCQVSPDDAINLFPGTLFQNDLADAFQNIKRKGFTRDKILEDIRKKEYKDNFQNEQSTND